MSTKAIAPRFSEDLFPLTLHRLQRQTARSGALDGRVLGVKFHLAASAYLVRGVSAVSGSLRPPVRGSCL